jgi:hypothetical protein
MIAQFTKLSGGLEGGADPPAFQRAEKQRLEAAERAEEAVAVKEAALEESICDTQHSDADNPKKVIVVFFFGGGGAPPSVALPPVFTSMPRKVNLAHNKTNYTLPNRGFTYPCAMSLN